MSDSTPCPCGSGQIYAQCCGRLLEAGEQAETAEQLMRSRYTAYTLNREDYLLASWHPSTRPDRLDLQNEPAKWIGLKILERSAGQAGDQEGTVHFIARYKLNGKAHRLEENSRFVFEQGRWFYLNAL